MTSQILQSCSLSIYYLLNIPAIVCNKKARTKFVNRSSKIRCQNHFSQCMKPGIIFLSFKINPWWLRQQFMLQSCTCVSYQIKRTQDKPFSCKCWKNVTYFKFNWRARGGLARQFAKFKMSRMEVLGLFQNANWIVPGGFRCFRNTTEQARSFYLHHHNGHSRSFASRMRWRMKRN